MRRVAHAVGVTPMAIYHHFPDREALLRSITDREFARLKEYSDKLLARAAHRSDLVWLVDAYLDYAFARPRIFDYVFSKPRFDARRFPRDFRARRSPTLTPMADFVAEAMADGRLAKDDVWEVALQLWAHAHGYLALYRAGRFQMSRARFRDLYHRAVRRLLRGLELRATVPRRPSLAAKRDGRPRPTEARSHLRGSRDGFHRRVARSTHVTSHADQRAASHPAREDV